MALDLLEQLLPHIRGSIYRQRLALPDWKMKEGEIDHAASPSLNDKNWTSIRVPFLWGKYDRTVWFRQDVEVPSAFAGKQLALLLNFPEALLYLNGKPFQGIDANHTEIPLTVRARAMESFPIAIEAYSGRKKELNSFATAELVTVDPNARRLFNALTALHELDLLQEHGSQESKDLREIIRRTLVFLKYFKPESDAYPGQIKRAYDELLGMLQNEYPSTLPGMIHLIGHSHLDVAWLWTMKETIRKCGRTFSGALRLLDEYPDFKFSQSQPVLYEMTREQYPDLYRQIKQRALEGRWEVMGSTYVEPDCNIPSGESLVRQIVFGKRFFRQEFNSESAILWLPDTFGYNWALPQILKKSGIRYFSTTKLTWNDTNKFPYSTFWWEGIDGTRILSHIPPVGIEGHIAAKDLQKSSTALQPGAPVPLVSQTYGFGDGGGGVTREDLERAPILRNIVGLPPSALTTMREFFTQMEAQVPPELPVWKNELYLEKHRGTLTTHGWLKKENRTGETALYSAELLSTLAMLFGKGASPRKYPQPELESLWKTLLVYQFHDILPGTCIKDAYEDVRAGYNQLQQGAGGLITKAVKSLPLAGVKGGKGVRFSIFNPLQHARAEYVELTVPGKDKSFRVTDANGTAIEHQIVGRSSGNVNLLCYLPAIPAFSFSQITVEAGTESVAGTDAWKVSTQSFETPLFKLRMDGKGAFSSIYDKTLRRELIPKGKRGNLLQTFQDTPKQWDAWDIDADFEKKRLELFEFKQVRVIEQGPLRMTLRLEFRTPNHSILTQDVRLYHKRQRIDFETHVKWQEKQTLLKVAFPLTAKSAHATYEIQFGAMRRTSKPTDSWDKAKFEVPAQQWADISEQKYGVSLLNDSKYAYDARESVLRLTLLRSPHYPHPIEPWHLNDHEITDAGEHRFVYALQPHAGDWRTGQSTRRARELNHPVHVIPGVSLAVPSFLQISKPNIFVDAVKKADADDAVILRLHEAHGESTDAALLFAFECREAAECDLLENITKELKSRKGKLGLKFKPFEIKTVRVVPKLKR